MEIIELTDIDSARRVWPVMSQLRTHLNEESFAALLPTMFAEGYRLVGAFDNQRCIAAAGFRITHFLHRGKNLYVDDLVSDEALRGKGYGKALLSWMHVLAKREDCAQLHLDSGVQRAGAHAFYFSQGMHISSYHFVQIISP
jgi:GNAT superfamily N-acetyltransferase